MSPASDATPSAVNVIPPGVVAEAAAGPHAPSAPGAPNPSGHHGSLGPLALGALGVVFGDIGTSPLYALKECVSPEHGVPPSTENVYGLLSLIFWALTLVVTVKYLTFIMRADNHGEGGILALLALVPARFRHSEHARAGFIAALVVFGAALLYGDGIITPAISVLSAIEGVEVAAPSMAPYVVPLTCVVLVGLFYIQRRGTAGIGRVFGPIMVLWFLTIGVLGAVCIARNPAVLAAVSPLYALRFCVARGYTAFVVLGSVVLAITGGEALYADMGHFGPRPIRLAWYALVLPSLVLNYFGQGALLLTSPDALANPFFAMVPSGLFTYLLVALSTAATVIASQALISGAYSLTHQAVQLGFLPRVTVRHTSSETEGQIYIPEVNWALAVACILLVLGFRESSRLAAAFGIAVSGTMGITTVVYYVVLRQTWGWSRAKALPLLVLFLTMDLSFFGANLLKFFDGGYVPLLVAGALFTVMMIWYRGRTLLREHVARISIPLDEFKAKLAADHLVRVPGTAVFLTVSDEGTPPILMHHVRHNKALQERVILLTVATAHVPRVAPDARVEAQDRGQGFYRVVIHVGYMELTNVPARLDDAARRLGITLDPADTSYYLARQTFLATDAGEMGRVAESIFAFCTKNQSTATGFFAIPPDRVVELGIQIDL